MPLSLGEEDAPPRIVRQSVESIWPVSSVAVGAAAAVVAIATAVAHGGVGAAVATAHAVPQRVAVAAPVAAREDSSREVVAVHGVRSGGCREQENALPQCDGVPGLLAFFIYRGSGVWRKAQGPHFHS